jgi:1-acyl-sn-glycerol-3-phosphate acyltransferase
VYLILHIFPEGGRSREPTGQLQLPLKIGIGKLIYEARPLLMPFYHFGMHKILPIGTAQLVDENWWQQRLGCAVEKVDPLFAWQQATHWVEQVLLDLERQVHPLSIEKGVL